MAAWQRARYVFLVWSPDIYHVFSLVFSNNILFGHVKRTITIPCTLPLWICNIIFRMSNFNLALSVIIITSLCSKCCCSVTREEDPGMR